MTNLNGSHPVRNPRTGVCDYAFTPPSPDELAKIAQRLRQGQQAWGSAPIATRIKAMSAWADAIEANAQAIGDAEFEDTSRYRLSHEVPHMVVAGIRSWCERAEQLMSSALLSGQSSIYPTVSFESQLKPYPLVGVIGPWNHPFLLSTLDALPALVAGCAVLIKPSEVTPRFIDPVMETVRQVPELAAVLHFVAGDGGTGAKLVDLVDAVCFTGSVATGRKVAESAARNFVPAFLELGGKDALIVTASADIDRATTAALRASVFQTGQVCFATERVYVHESIHDAFVNMLIEKANALELAYPDPRHGHINPFTFEAQSGIADSHLDDAVAKGAVIRAGGPSQILGGGHYMAATVLTNVNHDMRIMREETFAPITPVMAFATEAEAIALANDSEFGLSGAVIAGSVEEARRIGLEMDAGAIALQDAGITTAILRDAEKTSFNKSGLGGSRMGANGLLRFFRKKALMVNHAEPASMLMLGEDGYRD